MKMIKIKRLLAGAMLAMALVSIAGASLSLSGCLVCRDCGPGRHWRR